MPNNYLLHFNVGKKLSANKVLHLCGYGGQYELLLKLANHIETWQFRILAMLRNPELSVLAAISLRDDFIEMEPLKGRCAEM